MVPGPDQEVCAVSQSLKSVASSTEEKFVEIGKHLAPAIGILQGITAIFESLSAKLASDEMANATAELTRAASHVSHLAETSQGQRSVIASLKTTIDGISGNLGHMRQTVALVDILATNGKIQAANIDRSGMDFSVFTKEVDRMVKVAKQSLEGLNQDLSHLGHELDAASASHDEFAKNQAETVSNIPKWLADSVDSAAAHGRRAAEAAAMVREKSQAVGQKVGAAVMALQIGDATRQRIEHVGEALGLLHALLAAPSAAAAAKDAWWNSLGKNEHNIVIAEVCRLQAAQLSHAAQEFETEVARIVAALRGLSGDAGAILRLGSEAYGTSNQRRATFLGDLEENVTRALALLRDFRGAHDRANRFAGSVHDSVMRSSEHIETVRSLEVDLRLLGLNMTLKCNRLGEPGRALSTIAQELRDCADRTTDDARIVMSGLDSITKIADQMRAGGQAGAAEDVGAVEDMMTRSVRHFGEAGQDVAKALVSLAHDGDVVAKLLDETAARINFGDEICRVLRQAAAELDRIGRNADDNISDRAPIQRLKDEIQSKFGRRYTMESERAIHQQLSGESSHGNSTASPSLSVEAAQTSLEDILF